MNLCEGIYIVFEGDSFHVKDLLMFYLIRNHNVARGRDYTNAYNGVKQKYLAEGRQPEG